MEVGNTNGAMDWITSAKFREVNLLLLDAITLIALILNYNF